MYQQLLLFQFLSNAVTHPLRMDHSTSGESKVRRGRARASVGARRRRPSEWAAVLSILVVDLQLISQIRHRHDRLHDK